MPSTADDSGSGFEQATEVFRNAWSLYRRLVDHNYMRHTEMEQAARDRLLQRSAPFTMLDLGCGDGDFAAKVVNGTRVAGYVGVDLVATAADVARQRFEQLVPDVRILNCSLLDLAPDQVQPACDVILASYSVHHLSHVEKRRLLTTLREMLPEKGELILIDLVRRNDESRDQFLSRFHHLAEQKFFALSDDERQQVRAHMDSSDWPETLATLQQFGSDAGFDQFELLYRDPAELYAAVSLR